jgi:hypothetical protein
MYGSLDCIHHAWKNCPTSTAWKGSYHEGQEGKPTVILEGVCDHNLWFWHCFYGCAGSFNDLNVSRMSNLKTMFKDGTFAQLEQNAGVVPYNIGGEEFNALFLLVNEIYPKYSRFVTGLKDPFTQQEKSYTGWQEVARKDIERAFGVLQGQWKFMTTPVELMSLDAITSRVVTCLILHNMNVSDRVMKGDVRAVYKPTNIRQCHGGSATTSTTYIINSPAGTEETAEETDSMMTKHEIDGSATGSPTCAISGSTRQQGCGGSFRREGDVRNLGIEVDAVNRRWLHLSDPVEHARLYSALFKKYE